MTYSGSPMCPIPPSTSQGWRWLDRGIPRGWSSADILRGGRCQVLDDPSRPEGPSGVAPLPPPPPPAGSWTSPPPPPLPKTRWARGRPVPLHPMRVGEMLDAAINLYRTHWRTLMVIVAFVVVPPSLLDAPSLSTSTCAPTVCCAARARRSSPRSSAAAARGGLSPLIR